MRREGDGTSLRLRGSAINLPGDECPASWSPYRQTFARCPPVIPIEDAVRNKREVIAWRDGLKRQDP